MSSQDLIVRFESTGRIKGKYEKSIPSSPVFRVRRDESTETKPSIPSIRSLDAKCAAEDGSTYLIMAESELDYKVLGQLLTFFNLYREEHSHDKPPRLALICEKSNDQVVWLCGRLGIDVFELNEKGVARVEAKLLS